MLWYVVFKSIAAEQRKWRTSYPGDKETGSLAKGASTGRPRTSKENVESISSQSCLKTPKMSLACRSYSMSIPNSSKFSIGYLESRPFFFDDPVYNGKNYK